MYDKGMLYIQLRTHFIVLFGIVSFFPNFDVPVAASA